jgi:hypothetical protein
LAVEWWRKAADEGDAKAQYNLGIMYEDGKGGLPQSDALAVEWWRKAADQGLTNAQGNLGCMYFKGKGLDQNFDAALAWLRKAAAQGNDYAVSLIKAIQEGRRREQQQALLIGNPMKLVDLRAKPELNGQLGVVKSFDAASGRYTVKLDDGRGPFRLKRENLLGRGGALETLLSSDLS